MRDVVAIVTKRRRVEGKEPDTGNAEALDVAELFGEPFEVSDAVAVAVVVRADVDLINDSVFVPQGVGGTAWPRHAG
jgi:hypothetical protein